VKTGSSSTAPGYLNFRAAGVLEFIGAEGGKPIINKYNRSTMIKSHVGMDVAERRKLARLVIMTSERHEL
jgi:hypothetical protein